MIVPRKQSQFTRPMLIRNGSEKPLEEACPQDFGKLETWLQELLFKDPGLLPIGKIEPAFKGLIPIARELRTSRGPLDLLFINPTSDSQAAEALQKVLMGLF
jgi:hypothetical protein